MNSSSSLTMAWHPNFRDHEKIIRIRPYRPSDSEQVRELYKVGALRGRNSPLQVAYNTHLRGPTACLSYCILLLGLLLVTFPTGPRIRYVVGIVLCVAGCALFASLRFAIFSKLSYYLKENLNGDLSDIDKTFRMEPVINHNGENTGDYVPSGSSGFWVAEAIEKGSDMNKTKVIGSIGLDTNANSDKIIAELRRLVVSPDYRRRGIAISLIKTALHHARNHGVSSVVLLVTTTQPAAIAMYEKLGWVRQNNPVGARFGLLDKMWIFSYSLDLTTSKI